MVNTNSSSVQNLKIFPLQQQLINIHAKYYKISKIIIKQDTQEKTKVLRTLKNYKGE